MNDATIGTRLRMVVNVKHISLTSYTSTEQLLNGKDASSCSFWPDWKFDWRYSTLQTESRLFRLLSTGKKTVHKTDMRNYYRRIASVWCLDQRQDEMKLIAVGRRTSWHNATSLRTLVQRPQLPVALARLTTRCVQVFVSWRAATRCHDGTDAEAPTLSATALYRVHQLTVALGCLSAHIAFFSAFLYALVEGEDACDVICELYEWGFNP